MIATVFECFKIRKRYRSKFGYIRRFLKKGRYFPNETGTLWFPKRFEDIALSENKHIIIQIAYENQNGSKNNKNIKDKLIDRFYSQRVIFQPTLFTGDVVLMSRFNNVGKVIDYSKKEMLSYYADNKQMQSVVEKRLAWQNLGYNVLPIKKIDDTNCFFIENYIDKLDFPAEKGFDFVKNDILLRQKSVENELDRLYSPDEIARKAEEMKKFAGVWEDLYSAIDYIRSEEYVKRVCHGDLYRNNLLFDGKEFYYIDFELLNNHVFYFDIVSYFVCEYLMFNNGEMLNDYLDGVYDGYLEELFAVNGCKYDPKKKKIYFFTVLFEYYCETFQTDIPDKLMKCLR